MWSGRGRGQSTNRLVELSVFRVAGPYRAGCIEFEHMQGVSISEFPCATHTKLKAYILGYRPFSNHTLTEFSYRNFLFSVLVTPIIVAIQPSLLQLQVIYIAVGTYLADGASAAHAGLETQTLTTA